MTVIRSDFNRRMDSAKLWLNNAEMGTDVIESNDTNISNDAKLPEPLLPASEPQQQQIIQQNNDNVSGTATKDSNNNDGHANNDSEKSLISPSHPRPNVDIILSLKDPVYSSTMLGYFQLMGAKTTNNTAANEEGETPESVVAKKVLLHFKGSSTTTTVRFFKLLSRNLVDGKFKKVDEEAALRSEFTLNFQIIICPYLFGCC